MVFLIRFGLERPLVQYCVYMLVCDADEPVGVGKKLGVGTREGVEQQKIS